MPRWRTAIGWCAWSMTAWRACSPASARSAERTAMRGPLRYIAAALSLAAFLPACAPVRVHSYAVPATDLRSYRTYAWDARRIGRHRRSPARQQQLLQRARAAGRRRPDGLSRLRPRCAPARPRWCCTSMPGWSSGSTRAKSIPRPSRCDQDECRTYVYDQGTLLIDIVDARTKALIWRGWAERSLDGVVDIRRR